MKNGFLMAAFILVLGSCTQETLSDVKPEQLPINSLDLGKQTWKVVTTNTGNVNGFNINQTDVYFFADSTCYFVNAGGNQLLEQYQTNKREVWFKSIGRTGNNRSEWIVWNVSVYNENELILELTNVTPIVQIKMKAN
ncbi:MAG: hypothetical protein MUE96_01720 [Bacteroidia bacterium]|jgi:hypothetical protein|nr:hypothetical protein [Bacteroidia bacterium]